MTDPEKTAQGVCCGIWMAVLAPIALVVIAVLAIAIFGGIASMGLESMGTFVLSILAAAGLVILIVIANKRTSPKPQHKPYQRAERRNP